MPRRKPTTGGAKKGSRQHRVETKFHIYRAPFEERGRWWVRRRYKATKKVERILLDAENRTDAIQAIHELAQKETQAYRHAAE